MPKINKTQMIKAIAEHCAYTELSLAQARKAIIENNLNETDFDIHFAGGLSEIIDTYSKWMDDLTLERLNKTSSLPEKIRDKIELAVWIRLEEMAIYPEMTKSCAKYWVLHSPDKAGSNIWNTANMIWMWAGDTSKDHNYYTKRALLSSVIISTTLYWLNDSSEHKEKTKTFLNRRINNVLKFGQFIGRPVSSILKAASFLKARNCQAREKQNNEN